MLLLSEARLCDYVIAITTVEHAFGDRARPWLTTKSIGFASCVWFSRDSKSLCRWHSYIFGVLNMLLSEARLCDYGIATFERRARLCDYHIATLERSTSLWLLHTSSYIQCTVEWVWHMLLLSEARLCDYGIAIATVEHTLGDRARPWPTTKSIGFASCEWLTPPCRCLPQLLFTVPNGILERLQSHKRSATSMIHLLSMHSL